MTTKHTPEPCASTPIAPMKSRCVMNPKTYVSSDQAQGWGFVKGMGWVFLSTVKGDPGGDLCTMDHYCVRRSQVQDFRPFPSPEEIWGMLGTTPNEYWTMRLDACPDPKLYPVA